MLGEYLTQRAKAGVAAGLVFGLFMAVVANPFVGYAGDLDHATVKESGHTHETESTHSHEAKGARSYGSGDSHADENGGHYDTVVSMAVTKTVSIAAGGLWGVALGGASFEVAFFSLELAILGPDAAKSYLMGFAGPVTVSSAPWSVLPPVAPGAEQSLSTATWLLPYAGMMFAGVFACFLANYVCIRLRESQGLGVAFVDAIIPLGLLAALVVVALESAVCGAPSPVLETGPTGLFAFRQVLPWLILAVAHARFRPPSESKSEPGIPTIGRNSAPAAN